MIPRMGLGFGMIFFPNKHLKQTKKSISEYKEYKKCEFYLISEPFSLSLQCMVLFKTLNNGIKPLKLWFHFQTKQCDFSGKNKYIFAEKSVI